MPKIARIHPTKKATWSDIRQEFVQVQELASAVPRLWYQTGPRRRWRLVRGNMFFEYRPFKRQPGSLRAVQLRVYLKRCLISTKILSVELIWPDNQEVNGKVLVRKMRSALGASHVTRTAAPGF